MPMQPTEQPPTPQMPPPGRGAPGDYPGMTSPEIPNRPGPETEMPHRRGRPGQDVPRYPERPSREMPTEPGRVDQPEVPGVKPPPQEDRPPVMT
jgi:hypothetical protein